MSRPRTIEIIVQIPPDADVEETVVFCVDALTTMGGCRHPDDPLFHSVCLKKISAGGQRYQLTADGRDLVVADSEPQSSPPWTQCDV